MSELTHVDNEGSASMVDVSAKPLMARSAKAAGFVKMRDETLELIKQNGVQKGDVLTVAKIAGIGAAKRCGELIPLCHPLPLSHVEVECTPIEDGIGVTATAKTNAPTGVEMEALTAVSVAALTLYDMCKAVDKTMEIGQIRLLSKEKVALS